MRGNLSAHAVSFARATETPRSSTQNVRRYAHATCEVHAGEKGDDDRGVASAVIFQRCPHRLQAPPRVRKTVVHSPKHQVPRADLRHGGEEVA
eukprot:2650991-Rhodomonas_salina.4